MDNRTDPSASGLEGQLRNMIINNSEAKNDNYTPLQTGPMLGTGVYPATSSRYGGPYFTKDASEEGNHQSWNEPKNSPGSKAPRKRLNQAQRRQMGSQLSIEIDSRMQAPSIQSTPHRHQQRGFSQHSLAGPSQAEHAQSHGRGGFNHKARDSRHGSFHHNAQPRLETDWRNPRRQSTNPTMLPQGPFNSGPRNAVRVEYQSKAVELLDELAVEVLAKSEIERSEIAAKEDFRMKLQDLSQKTIAQYEMENYNNISFPSLSVELKCFGSLSSGFATKASDMDLGLISPLSTLPPDEKGSPIPRILEKALLDAGIGARLLTKTRVPIIKICQYPPKELYHELVEARNKWEQEEADDSNIVPEKEDVADQSAREVISELAPINYFEVPVGDHGEKQVFHLKQDRKNLAAYFALTKRVLRKAGSRDVTFSNFNELSQQEWIIIDRFCEAFIQGLDDPSLQQRLTRYPSLSFPRPGHHSLLGVYTQTEGETIVRNWEKSPIKRIVESYINEWTAPVKLWRNLLWKDISTTDPNQYAKDLQIQLEKIKRIPSVQLSTLEQSAHESPTQYFTRTKDIINALQRANLDLPSTVLAAVQNLYVLGIQPVNIKLEVSEEWDRNRESWGLEAIARRHSSFHLAWELEKALEKVLYKESLSEVIKNYIEILRRPLQKSYDDNFIVALPSEQTDILATITTIQDPHLMAINQPRDKYKDSLEFPKIGVGVQCDINFSAHLALHNTHLLRCYSLTDPRVRPMVLFIKHWAKNRRINSGYRGTLSSYGFALMALHYLINIAKPFVSPNLQHLAPNLPLGMLPADVERLTMCGGYNVHFWRNEAEIANLAQAKQLNYNQESLGSLLMGFFEYYAQGGMMTNGSGRGFDWGRDVISLRMPGGIISKQSKAWTEAKTVVETTSATVENSTPVYQIRQNETMGGETSQPKTKGEVKEVRLRYLFAIEDPFETDHNVARTVTHNGIVSIRDEFRRAWRIMKAASNGNSEENLLDDLADHEAGAAIFVKLLNHIHGIKEQEGGK